MQRRPKRIFITGAPGSGKSHLANRISGMTGIESYDLDDIRYVRKYDILRPRATRKQKLNAIARRNSWIISGTSLSFSGPAIKRAQLIIILRESFPLTTLRIARRFIKRKSGKRPPKETFGSLLGLIRYSYDACHKKGGYLFEQFRQIRKEYGRNVIILKSKKEVKTFLEQFE
jgi:energy-coupling factor transporter ATP-binding protein EcfA2